jgi:PTS system nitrogen regulatory IIA component
MNLLNAIQKESVSVSLQATTKSEVLEELLELAMRSGQIQDQKAALKSILEREKKMSTGMHHGLAIPHGKTAAVDRLVGAIGLAPQGIDFEAMDGQPSRIFILSISPANRAGPHIQFLAEISRLLNRQDSRYRLLAAKNAEELHAMLVQES